MLRPLCHTTSVQHSTLHATVQQGKLGPDRGQLEPRAVPAGPLAINLIYRTLHDLGESPRTAFGENRQGLSGVALNTELDPLLKKVQRKRLIRSAAYRRRNELILRVLERFTGESYAPYRTRIVWGPVLPQDRSRQVADERVLVEAGIHSRRRAAEAPGVEDPEGEFARWPMEEEHIREGRGGAASIRGGHAEAGGD